MEGNSCASGLFDQIRSRVNSVSGQGNQFTSRCPSHEDRQPSLSVKLTEDRVLIHCFAGCSYEQVLSDLGLASFVDREKTKVGATMEWFSSKVGIGPGVLRRLGVEEKEFEISTKARGAMKVRTVGIPYCDEEGEVKYWKLRVGPDANIKAKYYQHPRGSGSMLMGLDKPQSSWYVIAEGESDVLSLWASGLPAFGVPGASNLNTLNHPKLLAAERIYISQENDRAGEAFGHQAPMRLRELGFRGRIGILKIPQPHKDLNDLYRANPEQFEFEVKSLVDECHREHGTALSTTVQWKPGEYRDVEWLWKPYVPNGYVTLLAGRGGKGKSFITCSLASRASAGLHPIDDLIVKPKNILFIDTEDDPSVSGGIAHRMFRMGANLENVRCVSLEKHKRLYGTFLTLENCGQYLNDLLSNWRADLVIFDPVVRFMDGDNSMNSPSSIRKGMDNLNRIAKKFSTAVIAVGHFRKGSSEILTEMASGGADWVNASRSVIFAIPDVLSEREEASDGDNYGAICHVKINLAQQGNPYLYAIRRGDDGQASFEWRGPSPWSNDELVASEKQGEYWKLLRDIEHHIAGWLSDGPKQGRYVRKWLELNNGYSKLIVTRALKDLIASKRLEWFTGEDGEPSLRLGFGKP